MSATAVLQPRLGSAVLQQNGVEIIDEENRTTGIFTGRQMYFHDPDRNVFELTEWQGKEY